MQGAGSGGPGFGVWGLGFGGLVFTKAICARKVDVRLPGEGNSNSHGARPIHLIITMIKWIRTSRLSIKNSLSTKARAAPRVGNAQVIEHDFSV